MSRPQRSFLTIHKIQKQPIRGPKSKKTIPKLSQNQKTQLKEKKSIKAFVGAFRTLLFNSYLSLLYWVSLLFIKKGQFIVLHFLSDRLENLLPQQNENDQLELGMRQVMNGHQRIKQHSFHLFPSSIIRASLTKLSRQSVSQ